MCLIVYIHHFDCRKKDSKRFCLSSDVISIKVELKFLQRFTESSNEYSFVIAVIGIINDLFFPSRSVNVW